MLPTVNFSLPSPPPCQRLLPLFVEGTLKGDVLLHGGVQQPRFLRSIGHGASLPGKSRVGVGRHFQGTFSEALVQVMA